MKIGINPLLSWFSRKQKNEAEGRAAPAPLPEDVPHSVREAYGQACFLLQSSPWASGALSRYALQKTIRDFWHLAPDEQGTIAAELDLISDRLPEETLASIQCVRQFGSIDSQLSRDRDMMVETSVDEARVLIALLQLLSREWYEARRKRQAHLEAIHAMIEQVAAGHGDPAGGEAAAFAPPQASGSPAADASEPGTAS